jgi:hypothetical protein
MSETLRLPLDLLSTETIDKIGEELAEGQSREGLSESEKVVMEEQLEKISRHSTE